MSSYTAPEESTIDTNEVVVSGWVPRRFADELAELARLNDRSVSREVKRALRRHLEDARATGALAA